jgi:hypothetical protein
MYLSSHIHKYMYAHADGWQKPAGEWVGLQQGSWKKRKRDATNACTSVWDRFTRAELAGTAFRDATIDKWNSKVLMAAGGGKSFKALNQSILQQTAQVMQDMPR